MTLNAISKNRTTKKLTKISIERVIVDRIYWVLFAIQIIIAVNPALYELYYFMKFIIIVELHYAFIFLISCIRSL